MEFDLVLLSAHIVSLTIYDEPSVQPWAFTFIYSPVNRRDKEDFWAHLSQERIPSQEGIPNTT